MAFTTHGHHIPGTLTNPPPTPSLVDCAGPNGCAVCSEEAANILEKEARIFRVKSRHGMKGRVKHHLDKPRNPDLWAGEVGTHISSVSCTCGVEIIEQTVIHANYTDEEALKQLESYQAHVLETLHRIHLDAAVRKVT
ncbi:hypothetical protein HWC66_gp81 [Gordonia phage Chikenjars]|uniref:Uncharacterized protein n=1 Tax=Gordonia phage Chikenjars TaxID=2601686 RepID=A0A5J6D962_9CAUD|nr:hypothetical protein HWC66_gp81 [Gordonia phage Chikenjars]QEQ94384.1 hypothetical protein SEA_CHIKENJARS_81 [Gordonia phage Chikenjars]